MVQVQGSKLKCMVEGIKRDIAIYSDQEDNIGAVNLTWTIYGWQVEVSLYDLTNVDIRGIKEAVYDVMDKAGFEVIKITLEV